MSDVPVFLVANVQITDPERYHMYEKGFFPILKRYGGEFVTYDDAPITFEGMSPREGRMIILKFPSEAQAKSWIEDEEYQTLSEHRRAGTQLQFLTLVRGLPPRS